MHWSLPDTAQMTSISHRHAWHCAWHATKVAALSAWPVLETGMNPDAREPLGTSTARIANPYNRCGLDEIDSLGPSPDCGCPACQGMHTCKLISILRLRPMPSVTSMPGSVLRGK
jgi:hypothetical protein